MGIVAEEWRPLPGQWSELKYEISNQGNVRSLYRDRRPCKFGLTARGYSVVWLYKGNRKYTKTTVHRLVAQSFVPGQRPGLQINHKNGIKTDNRDENLEWVTPRENVRHAIETGLWVPRLHQACKDHTASLRKFDDATVEQIRKRRKSGRLYAEIAEEYGVHTTTIGLICRGVHYKTPQQTLGGDRNAR